MPRLVSASLALPPGPLGMLTVLPDLFVIWKIQRQLVADIFALHGRTVELTRTHMLYCLFRHMASQVLRDVVVRAGERADRAAIVVAGPLIDAPIAGQDRRAAPRRNVREPMGAAGGGRRRRCLCVLGHAAGRAHRTQGARDDDAVARAAISRRRAPTPPGA